MKPVTEESVAKLYHALGGSPPARELTEAQREAQLKRQCLYEIETVRQVELMERLAHILGVSVSPNTSDAAVERLYETLR